MSKHNKPEDVEEALEALEEVEIHETDDTTTEETTTEEVTPDTISVSDVMEYAKATKTPLELFDGTYTTLAELNVVVVKERTRVAALMESTPAPQPNGTGDTTTDMSEAEQIDAYEKAIDGVNATYLGD